MKQMKQVITVFILVIFTSVTLLPSSARAQAITVALPQPGTMVSMSPAFVPPVLKGIKIYPDNPLLFDFLIDEGDQALDDYARQQEYQRQVRYFMAALTTPEEDMWVNLSPHENNRIVPDAFGMTEMGRDLLAQDYILKQLTASLMYPEAEVGQRFWKNIYQKAYEQYGITDIPVNTFNKVWITPDEATVYEKGGTAIVGENRLKVMLESDYMAFKHNFENGGFGLDAMSSDDATGVNDVSSAVVRDVVLPEIEKEVNEGQNFVKLRQIYHAMILAAWFKKRLENSVLNKIYVDKQKIGGIKISDEMDKEAIYNKYIEAYQKGVYNFIKEEYDPFLKQEIPRKYFSGGFTSDLAQIVNVQPADSAMLTNLRIRKLVQIGAAISALGAGGAFVLDRVAENDRKLQNRFGAQQTQNMQQAESAATVIRRFTNDSGSSIEFIAIAREAGVTMQALIEANGPRVYYGGSLSDGRSIIIPFSSVDEFANYVRGELDQLRGSLRLESRFIEIVDSIDPNNMTDELTGILQKVAEEYGINYDSAMLGALFQKIADFFTEEIDYEGMTDEQKVSYLRSKLSENPPLGTQQRDAEILKQLQWLNDRIFEQNLRRRDQPVLGNVAREVIKKEQSNIVNQAIFGAGLVLGGLFGTPSVTEAQYFNAEPNLSTGTVAFQLKDGDKMLTESQRDSYDEKKIRQFLSLILTGRHDQADRILIDADGNPLDISTLDKFVDVFSEGIDAQGIMVEIKVEEGMSFLDVAEAIWPRIYAVPFVPYDKEIQAKMLLPLNVPLRLQPGFMNSVITQNLSEPIIVEGFSVTEGLDSINVFIPDGISEKVYKQLLSKEVRENKTYADTLRIIKGYVEQQKDGAMVASFVDRINDLQVKTLAIAETINWRIKNETIFEEFTKTSNMLDQIILDERGNQTQMEAAEDILQQLEERLEGASVNDVDIRDFMNQYIDAVQTWSTAEPEDIDSEMTSGVDNAQVGGIDLNREFLNLNTEGEAIEVITPEQLRYLETMPIEGLVPNIISITPGTVNTLPFFSEIRDELPFEDMAAIRHSADATIS